MSDEPLQIDIVTDTDAFEALRDEWDELWSRVDGRHSQAFSVCRLSWIHVARPQGRKLRCVTCRRSGKLVMVWPLVTYRRFLWTVIRPLSPDTAEQSSVLADADPETPAMLVRAWHEAVRRTHADLILLPYVSSDSPLHDLAHAYSGAKYVARHLMAFAPLSKEPDWETFSTSLGTLSGRKPGARKRRLAKEGELVTCVLESNDVREYERWIDWILSSKGDWAERVDMEKGRWLHSPGYRDFLAGLLAPPEGQPSGRLFIVTLDGAPIAATLVGLGKSCVSGLITGFDQDFKKFSPGNIVVEECFKWTLEHHFDLDLGIGSESYKQYWSRDNFTPVWSFQIAATAWGALAFHIRDLAHALRRGARIGRHDALPNA
jgi:CelD/BcsL family acetyltransferase involved in cellulose biosynthesis